MNHPTQGLQIHIHKTDGSVTTFTQSEANLVNSIVNEFQPTQLFNREKIIIAGDNALTSFPARQVVRIDLVSEPPFHWILPPGIVDAVELTETEFRALLQNPELGDRWDQARAQNASVVAFLEVEMAGQPPLFLALEVPLEPPVDRPEAILYPLYPLTLPGLCFRMRTGGIASLNLVHLLRFTLFPAPQQTPAEAWPAHSANGPQPDRVAGDSRAQINGKPQLSRFAPGRRTNFTSARSNQNENEPKMERKHQ